MLRADLLALTSDDLATLSTRGRVNEARRDLDDLGVSGELTESPAGDLRVVWSDGRTSELPAGSAPAQGRCSCNAVDLCKHLVRLVLLYQRRVDAPAAAEPWDPGAISDNELGRHYRPAALKKLHRQFEEGILAELVRGSRPVARFHVPTGAVRFLVPGDLRYTRCDCARPAPCDHVALAVWAFRRLDPALRAGVVSAGAALPDAPEPLPGDLDALLAELAIQGVSGSGKEIIGRLARLENACRDAGLVWPAELLAGLATEQGSYAAHDARFDPAHLADLLGELAVRLAAIRAGSAELPQALIRGSTADRAVELSKGLYWGLGCGVRPGRSGVEMIAYLHDVRSGGVVTVSKQVPDAEAPRSFAQLGRHAAVKGASYAALGVGVLQLDGGRRTAGYELLPGRAPAVVSVQERFSWEEIAPPVLVEEFAELEDRLATLPPSALRPRRRAEDYHVLQVAAVQQARFDAAAHRVQAVLVDRRGRQALLEHPWTSRGRAGAETLLARLGGDEETIRFVAGPVRRSMAGLVVQPVCLVWQQGQRRVALQPWIEGDAEAAPADAVSAIADRAADEPVREYLRQLQRALGELLVLGLSRADAAAARTWRELVGRGEALGCLRLSGRADLLAKQLEAKAHTLRWDARPVAALVRELTALARLARDVA